MTSKQISRPDWLDWPEVQAFTAHCQAKGVPIRFVGGCVRDTLMGRTVRDIDVASAALPQQVMEAFADSPYKVIPTGLKHGTVTVVVQGKPFEVTTLRRDVACDGRHAEVQFTDDWQEDALRRDFTMNALMLSPDAELYDYTDGEVAAKDGHITFIGDAKQRIQEDYLRILRMFRFYATHGSALLDKQALEACQLDAHHLQDLSVERIAQEMLKLLAAPNPLPAMMQMQHYAIWPALGVEGALHHEAMIGLMAREQYHAVQPDALLRLALLLGKQARGMAKHWKLSKKQQAIVARLLELPALVSGMDVTLCLYRYGREVTQLCALRDEARGGEMVYEIAQTGDIPVLPVSGKDLMQQGEPAGKALGDKLKALEQRWIDSGFTLGREALLK